MESLAIRSNSQPVNHSTWPSDVVEEFGPMNGLQMWWRSLGEGVCGTEVGMKGFLEASK